MLKLSGLPDPLEDRPLRERLAPAVLLFVVAFAARAVYAWVATGPGAVPVSDPEEYDQVAWNLATGVGFWIGTGQAAHATAFVPPVVPWVVSLLYRVVGHDYFSAILLQCAIGATVPLLTVRFGEMLFGSGIGRVAGWLAALHPLLVFFSAYLLTETTFTAALLAGLVFTTQWVRKPGGRRALVAGLAWGLASLTRPTAMLLPALAAAWAWIPLGIALEPRDRIRQIALVALGAAIVIAPWTLRNASVFGTFVPVTTGGGRALLVSNNPETWDDPVLRGGGALDFSREPYASMIRGGTEIERDARARREAIAFAFSRMHQWPSIAVAKFTRFWRFTAEGGGTGAWQRNGSGPGGMLRAVDPFLLWSLVVMPLAAWGLARSLQGPRRWFQSLPAWAIVYFTGIALVFWGSLRMRVPVEPLVVLMAAVGFDDVRRRIWPRLRRPPRRATERAE